VHFFVPTGRGHIWKFRWSFLAAALCRITLKEMTELVQRFHPVANDFDVASIGAAKMAHDALNILLIH
jgi:hypothetical protein